MVTLSPHAVITGGNGHLAQVISQTLQHAGFQISAPSHHELDVSDDRAVADYFQNRKIDLLICNAGLTLDAPLARLSLSAWEQTLAVNWAGAHHCANAALPFMQQQQVGHILFISSFSAKHPPLGQVAYATAKAALLGLTRQLAAAHGLANIRVNAILPGFLETRMTESLPETRRAEVLAAHTLGRLNTCEAVAQFIQHLHQYLPHTSGQIFQLDSRLSD